MLLLLLKKTHDNLMRFHYLKHPQNTHWNQYSNNNQMTFYYVTKLAIAQLSPDLAINSL